MFISIIEFLCFCGFGIGQLVVIGVVLFCIMGSVEEEEASQDAVQRERDMRLIRLVDEHIRANYLDVIKGRNKQ